MKKRFAFTLALLFTTGLWLPLCAQQADCKVLLPEIANRYEGKCKNGLANGKGIAQGTDTYEGKFKNGLPHGFGTYKWANGDTYEGFFVKGKMEGKGIFKGKINGRDSVYTGMWHQGKLEKVILPPRYSVLVSRNVTRYTITKNGATNRLLFSFMQNGTTNPNITNLQILCDNGTTFRLGEKIGFENVLFPVSCKVTYATPNSLRTVWYDVTFEFTINEKGEWVITLHN